MSTIRDFKDLKIWKDSSRFAVDIYKLCSKLPKNEKYGLSSQMQRSAVSIPSNIAEGHRRRGDKEFKHFLYISLGSAAELETQLYICSEVYGINLEAEIKKIVEIQKMINGLIRIIK